MRSRHGLRRNGKRQGLSPLKKEWRGERIGLLGSVRELVLALLSGLLPWWFGANDPPAIYVISVLIAILGLTTLVEALVKQRRRGLDWLQILIAPPVLGLSLVALYGFVQWVEISPGLLQTLSPTKFNTWKLWGGGETIVPPGQEGVAVSIAARLGWLDGETLESVVWLASLWVLVVCVIRLPGRWGPLKRHGLVMIVSSALMGMQSMLQAMTFNGKVLWTRPAGIVISSAGPFFVHSHLAAYLNMGLGFAMAHLLFMNWRERPDEAQDHLFADERSGLGRGFIWMYTGGIILVSVLASRSRGGLLAMFMGFVVLGLVWAVAARKFRRIAVGSGGWTWVLGFLGVVIFALTMLTDVFAIFSRAKGIVGGEGGHAAGVRRRVWALAYETWKEAPVWGTGWGSYLWASQTKFNAAVGYSTHAESDYVQILPEGGLIGSLLVVGTLVFLAIYCLRLVNKLYAPGQFISVGGALFAMTAVAWGSLTENNMRTAGVAIPAIITAAHVVRMALGWKWFEDKMSEEEADQTRLDLGSRVLGGLFGCFLTAVAVLGVQQSSIVKKAWNVLRPVGLNIAGTELLGWYAPDVPDETLENQRVALKVIEPVLPRWGDYHIRQAIGEVETYERRIRDVLMADGIPEIDAVHMSQLLYLTVILRDLPEDERATTIAELLEDPIAVDHLGQAARSLAKAWRQEPSSAMVHAEIALLSWIFEKGPKPEESLKRAILLVGERREILLRIGLTAWAMQLDDMATLAFSTYIAIPESSMNALLEIAQLRADSELVERLTDQSAFVAVRTAEALIPEDESDRRHRAGEKALEKLRQETGLDEALSVELRARALWLTGNREEALTQIKLAMALNTSGFDLRDRQIHWLIAAGQTKEAFDQAQVVQYLWPGDARAKALLNLAAEADAKGVAPVTNQETPDQEKPDQEKPK